MLLFVCVLSYLCKIYIGSNEIERLCGEENEEKRVKRKWGERERKRGGDRRTERAEHKSKKKRGDQGESGTEKKELEKS